MRDEVDIVARHMETAPVDPEAIINELGIRFVTDDLPDGSSGYISKRGPGRYEIGVNIREGQQRRRFTAAHELAHYLLHRDLLDERQHLDRLFDEGTNDPSMPLSPRHEVQANKLAAQILMPGAIVRQLHNEGLTTSEIARRLNVSTAAMRIRLKTLGFEERSVADRYFETMD